MNYFTTDSLIESIKLRAMIPNTEVTFTEDDFLSFLNEQMSLHVVPHILSFHEDYLLFTEYVDLVPGQIRYAIPSRAIGSKLRDVSASDGNNVYELTRVQVEDISDITFGYNYNYSRQFYIEGGDIVVSDDLPRQRQQLRISYYLRPNKLVSQSIVSVATAVNYKNGIVSVDKAPVVFSLDYTYDITSCKQPHKLLVMDKTADGIPSEENLSFTFGTARDIEVTLPALVGDYNDTYITIVDKSLATDVTYVYYFGTVPAVPGTLIECDISAAVTTTDVIDILVGQINATFSDARIFATTIDATTLGVINGGAGISVGNNFTVESTIITNTLVNSEGTVTIPRGMLAGDIIGLAETTIIPQIPSELHPMLAQGAAMRCLEALGDTQGLQNAAAKLADMEQKTATLIENRVESSPLKVVPRHSLLRRK